MSVLQSTLETGTADFFRAYFLGLVEERISFVILHGYEGYPACIGSDVDFCVAPGDLERAVDVLWALAEQRGWRAAQCIQHEPTAWFWVLTEVETGAWLQLDFCTHYFRRGRLLWTADYLLEGRREHAGFFIPAPDREFAYLLAKALAKPLKADVRGRRLRDLWNQAPDPCRDALDRLLSLRVTLENPPCFSEEDFAAWRKVLVQTRPFGGAARVRELWRRVQRVLRPTGLWVAFLGPDGSGKSAVIAGLLPLVSSYFRRVQFQHLRPSVGSRRPKDGPSSTVEDPHGRPERSRLGSWAKLAYYLADAWLGFFFFIVPGRVRSTWVVYDRWLVDVLVDPKRYRLRLPGWVLRGFVRLLPQPDLVFVLDAPTEVLQARKQEVPPEETERQRHAYRSLADSLSCAHLISVDRPVEAAVADVRRQVADFLEQRLRRGKG